MDEDGDTVREVETAQGENASQTAVSDSRGATPSARSRYAHLLTLEHRTIASMSATCRP